MTRTVGRKNSRALASPVVATGIAATVVIAIGAFVLSFAALTDLAIRSGIGPSLAWIWPVIIDGLIVAATVAIVALAGRELKVLFYPWGLLIGGAGVSTVANAVHAIFAVEHTTVPAVVAAVVASMPPLVLLTVTHLSVVLVQNSAMRPAAKKAMKTSRKASATAGLQSPPVPVPAPEAQTLSVRESFEPAVA
ncbi:DUF2637 domain-containing protein [Arthrobacter sp. NPDC057013]|uniref:DUF2637 domain-containing protein n=1 Tax=Arthrobacter sp. NPDC057013 TaxID=3345999 RepID=UPI00363EA136